MRGFALIPSLKEGVFPLCLRTPPDKEKIKEQKHKYYEENKERKLKYSKKYYTENLEKAKESRKTYHIKNKNSINERHRLNYKENYKEILEKHKLYNKSEAGKISKNKHIHIRKRELGFNPINSKFEGSNFHHFIKYKNGTLDSASGIYIPEVLHKSIPHSRRNYINIDKINALAISWILHRASSRAVNLNTYLSIY